MEVDYYYLLGVSENASSKDIKIAYRKMAEVYHPDKLRELPEDRRKEGEEIMRILNEAKSILLNPDRRAAYDHRVGVGLEVQEAMIVEPSRAEEFLIAIEKETMASKMSRVLDSMKVVFKNNRDFQTKIAVAEEIFEAQVIDDTRTSDTRSKAKKIEDEEIEMKLSFQVVDDKASPPPANKESPAQKKFRIIAIEGDDDDAVSEDDEVDVEWD